MATYVSYGYPTRPPHRGQAISIAYYLLTRAFHNTQSTVVVVDQHGNATIGSYLGEPFFFLDVLHDIDALENIVGAAICFLELFKNDTCLVAVWCTKGQKLEAFAGD